MDFKEINKTDVEKLIGRYITLKKQGSELLGLCPFHADDHPSLAVIPRKNIWYCPACDSGHSAIDFVMKYHNLTAVEAAKQIQVDTLGGVVEHKHEREPDAPRWEWLRTLPQGAPQPTFEHYNGQPVKAWKYTDTAYTARFELPNGRKDVKPYTLRHLGDTIAWRWEGMDAPRPLYSSGRQLSDTIILVEGEKTCDALNAVLNTAVAVTWCGGANGVKHTDFSPLHGRNCLYWPDYDWQGYAAMCHVRELIGGGGQFINSPAGAPKGWDFADAGWTAAETSKWVRLNKFDPPTWAALPEWANRYDEGIVFTFHGKTGALVRSGDRITMMPKPPDEPRELPPPPPPPVVEKPRPFGWQYFRHLGYEMNDSGSPDFMLYGVQSRKIHRFSPSKFTTANLCTIAPFEWWERQCPKSKGGIELDTAAVAIINSSYAAGIYNPDMVRGRGAWIDQNRYVLHVGDHLIVDGIAINFGDFDSDYIYEVAPSLDFHTGKPATTEQGAEFIKFLSMLSWEREVNASLLAGWCMIAPVCGALSWRPHMWITGSSGTGKTWIMKNIVSRIMERCALFLQGETTEAGIRQTLCSDALPVVFDEAEADDRRSIERMDQILNLMRISSADGVAKMLKGSASHSARSFNIRSMFMFASIIYGAKKQADRNRVTVLGLEQNRSAFNNEHFEKIQAKCYEVLTDDFVAGIHARCIQMLPTLKANIAVFSKVAAEVLKSQRVGDQVAPMLAGAYLLTRSDVVSEKTAMDIMKKHNWKEELSIDEVSDEQQCLDTLLQAVVTVEEGEYGARVERTAGELIEKLVCGGAGAYEAQYRDKLLRMGIKIQGGTWVLSTRSEWANKVLAATPWARNYSKILLRLPDAEPAQPLRFGAGAKSRGVVLSGKIFD
jgi:putative DNA primase/helicase